jgi:hypothetical protein
MFHCRVHCATWLLLLAAHSPVEAQDQRAALLRADLMAAQLSVDSGLASALHRSLHREGLLLWPGAPVVAGRSDLETFLRLQLVDSLRLTWQALGFELAADSSLGATWGVAVSTSLSDARAAPRVGRYIASWRRDSGQWSIAAAVFIAIQEPGATRSWRGLPSTRSQAGPGSPAAPFIGADLGFARLAADSGAAIAFRRWAAPEALSFGGGSLLVRGPEAISRGVAGPERWRWHPVAGGTARSGDLGWTAGEATITRPDGTALHSKYLTIWTREANGTIRFLFDGGNARPPVP